MGKIVMIMALVFVAWLFVGHSKADVTAAGVKGALCTTVDVGANVIHTTVDVGKTIVKDSSFKAIGSTATNVVHTTGDVIVTVKNDKTVGSLASMGKSIAHTVGDICTTIGNDMFPPVKK